MTRQPGHAQWQRVRHGDGVGLIRWLKWKLWLQAQVRVSSHGMLRLMCNLRDQHMLSFLRLMLCWDQMHYLPASRSSLPKVRTTLDSRNTS